MEDPHFASYFYGSLPTCQRLFYSLALGSTIHLHECCDAVL